MDANALANAMGWSLSERRYAELLPTFEEAMVAAGCTTVRRAAMWCAQLGTESGGLQWMRELASGAEYEGRPDLGNTQPGDGVRYAGRGPIQVTGRYNYRSFSVWAFTRGYTKERNLFEAHPELLEQPKWGFLGATWYWTTHGINDFADRADVDGATLAINGGDHGIADRKVRWQRCLQIGTALLPKEDDMFTDEDRALLKAVQKQNQLILDQFGPDIWNNGKADLGKNPNGSSRWLREGLAALIKKVGA